MYNSFQLSDFSVYVPFYLPVYKTRLLDYRNLLIFTYIKLFEISMYHLHGLVAVNLYIISLWCVQYCLPIIKGLWYGYELYTKSEKIRLIYFIMNLWFPYIETFVHIFEKVLVPTKLGKNCVVLSGILNFLHYIADIDQQTFLVVCHYPASPLGSY